MTLQPIPTRLSLTKRVVFSIVTLACLAGLVEMTALVAYRGLAGRWHDPGGSASSRAEWAAPAEGQAPPGQLPPYMVGDVIYPYVGFVIDPSQSPVSRSGFPSDPLARSERELRVAVFGGSVAGTTAQAIANVLPGFLDQRGIGPDMVDVLNLGLGGGKQPQQMLALAYLQSLGARFDVVVNFDEFNEIVLPTAEIAFAPHPRLVNSRIAVTSSPSTTGTSALGDTRTPYSCSIRPSSWRGSELVSQGGQCHCRSTRGRFEVGTRNSLPGLNDDVLEPS